MSYTYTHANPPPRLARTAFLIFRRQAPLYHLLTYTLVPPYFVPSYLLRDLNPAPGRGVTPLHAAPGPLKINIFSPRTSKNKFFAPWTSKI